MGMNSTEEYGNTQIISTDYTEAFYNCFNRNYKLLLLLYQFISAIKSL